MKKFGETIQASAASKAGRRCSTPCSRAIANISAASPKNRRRSRSSISKTCRRIKEFELFKEYFESHGYPSIICSPDELEFHGGELSCKGTIIDIVYKRLLVNEYLPIMDEYPALLDAYRAGAICMVNSFRGKLVHKKAIFAVLTNEKIRESFHGDELDAIRAHVPWTRKFREEQTVNRGETIDLVEWTRANSHKLVLKPNDDYGGHGIYIGWNSTAAEWDDAIDDALWQTAIISSRNASRPQRKCSR